MLRKWSGKGIVVNGMVLPPCVCTAEVNYVLRMGAESDWLPSGIPKQLKSTSKDLLLKFEVLAAVFSHAI